MGRRVQRHDVAQNGYRYYLMQRLGGQGMQIRRSYRRVTSLYAVFATMMCCILLALSSCGNPAKGSIGPSTPKTPGSSPTSLPLHPRIGGPEATTDSILRAQLARVQQLMAGMSLDQKLGQLIMLEYLGNSYEGSGLQYMIARQFVGGFMYQESNHNFDTPSILILPMIRSTMLQHCLAAR